MTRAVPSEVVFWVVDHTAAVVGLLALGFSPGRPAWATVASVALGVALLQWIAETNGVHLPRPGRTRIVTYGCWEQPLVLAIRRRARTLLFFRQFDPAGNLPDEYQVFALPVMSEAEVRSSWGSQPLPEGHLLGSVPAASLRFDHRNGSYVLTSSLEAIESMLRADYP